MKIDDKNILAPQAQIYKNTKDIEELKAKYETQLKAVDAELDTLDDSISNQISKNTIKLA